MNRTIAKILDFFIYLVIIIFLSSVIIFIFKIGKTYLETKQFSDNATAGLILTYTGILISIFSVSIGIAFYVFKKRIEKFLQSEDVIRNTVLICTQMISMQIPSFYDTQHIPNEVCKLASKITNYFEHSLIFKSIGADDVLIHYIIGIYYFAIGKYQDCIKKMNNIVDTKSNIDNNLLLGIYERIGICFRYLDKWDKSINNFQKMYDNARFSEFYQDRAKMGEAITHFRMYKYSQNRTNLNSAVEILSDLDPRIIIENSQAFYYAYIYDQIDNLNIDQKKKIIEVSYLLLGIDPEEISKDCSIQANYYEAKAMCHMFLFKYEEKKAAHKNEATGFLNKARILSLRAEEEGIKTIYSEKYIGEALPYKFRKGLDGHASKLDSLS